MFILRFKEICAVPMYVSVTKTSTPSSCVSKCRRVGVSQLGKGTPHYRATKWTSVLLDYLTEPTFFPLETEDSLINKSTGQSVFRSESVRLIR